MVVTLALFVLLGSRGVETARRMPHKDRDSSTATHDHTAAARMVGAKAAARMLERSGQSKTRSSSFSSPGGRAPTAAIFADYDGCFDIINPKLAEYDGTMKNSPAWFEKPKTGYPAGNGAERDIAVTVLNNFLDEITRDRERVILFVGSNRQSLKFDRVMKRTHGFAAIGEGGFEAIAAARGWQLNKALVADAGVYGSAWTDASKAQPIEIDQYTSEIDEQNLKVMMCNNNLAELQKPEWGGNDKVDAYFFDDGAKYLSAARGEVRGVIPVTIPANVKFYTVQYDWFAYVIEGERNPLVANVVPQRPAGVRRVPRANTVDDTNQDKCTSDPTK